MDTDERCLLDVRIFQGEKFVRNHRWCNLWIGHRVTVALCKLLTALALIHYGNCDRKGPYWDPRPRPRSRRRLPQRRPSPPSRRSRLREDNMLRTIPLQRSHKVRRTRSLRQHRRTTLRIQSQHAALRLGLQETRKRRRKPAVNPLQPTIKTGRSEDSRRTARSYKTRRGLATRIRLPGNRSEHSTRDIPRSRASTERRRMHHAHDNG